MSSHLKDPRQISTSETSLATPLQAPISLPNIIQEGIELSKRAYLTVLPLAFLHAFFSALPAIYYTIAEVSHGVGSVETRRVALNNSVHLIGTLTSIVSFIFVLIIYAALLYQLHNIATRKPIDITNAISTWAKRIFPLLGLLFMYTLSILLFVLVFLVIPIVASMFVKNVETPPDSLIILFYLAILIPAVFMSISLFFSFYLLIVRKLGIIESLKGSWKLISGNWWRTAIIIVGLSLLMGIITMILSYPFQNMPLISLGIQILFQALLMPVITSIFLITFYDLELRKTRNV